MPSSSVSTGGSAWRFLPPALRFHPNSFGPATPGPTPPPTTRRRTTLNHNSTLIWSGFEPKRNSQLTMPYYVLGHGGAKYGPVELGTLNAWAQEGRIVPDTLIEDAGSGVKTPARAVPGLVLRAPSSPAAPAPATPLAPVVPQSNYLRPGQGTGGSSQNLFLPPQDQSSFH